MNKSEKIEVLGVELEWKLTAAETGNKYCVLLATIPPGVTVPPHRHPDQEAFYILEGNPHFASETGSGFEWNPANPGDMINMAPNALHGFHNPTHSDVRVLITCTPNLGRFFQDVGLPIDMHSPYRFVPPPPKQVQRVIEIALRYGQSFVATA